MILLNMVDPKIIDGGVNHFELVVPGRALKKNRSTVSLLVSNFVDCWGACEPPYD